MSIMHIIKFLRSLFLVPQFFIFSQINIKIVFCDLKSLQYLDSMIHANIKLRKVKTEEFVFKLENNKENKNFKV